MRELLFRGFHPCDGPDTIVVDGEKVKGRWVEGYIVRHPSAVQIGNDYSPWYIHVPPVDPDDNGGVFNVLPSTVGQYSGLTDQNGKKVWEGDIMRGCGIVERTGPVVFDKGTFMISGISMIEWDALQHGHTEVIGTVFGEEESK